MLDEYMEIDIYAYTKVMDKIKKYFNWEVILAEAIQKVLSKPYYEIASGNIRYHDYLKDRYFELVRIKLYYPYAIAWKRLPDGLRDHVIDLIIDELWEMHDDLMEKVNWEVMYKSNEGGEA
jgi:hypothetical protein